MQLMLVMYLRECPSLTSVIVTNPCVLLQILCIYRSVKVWIFADLYVEYCRALNIYSGFLPLSRVIKVTDIGILKFIFVNWHSVRS